MPAPRDNKGTEEAARRIDEARDWNAPTINLANLNLTAVPNSLAHLSNLEDLSLDNNQLTAIPEFLVQLSNLRRIYLSNNHLTAIPDFLGHISNLEVLKLNGNKLTSIPNFLGRFPNLQILNLNGNQLTAVPDSLGQLSNLRELYLSGNQLTAVPDSLGRLSHLREFHLSDNQLTTIPDSLGQLSHLRDLYLTSNKLIAIPASLGQLSNLHGLALSDNQLTHIPDSLGQLSNLRVFDLSSNQLTVVPDSLCQLSNLQRLDVSSNQFSALPDSLGQLSNLRELDLSSNQLTVFPDSLCQLPNLQRLDLSKNQLTAVRRSLAQLGRLQILEIDGNPLPEELFAALANGLSAFFRYLDLIASRRVCPRTVKLVLLGEPKSGKTTLLEALKGNPQPCIESRQETIGVDVVTLTKRHPSDGQPMYLSVWDFAGQHIEHATHQFFLTENAIFLVLWNARQGVDSGKHDLWYWLELLRMRVRKPNFLLVATHTEHTPPDLNLSEIERSYDGCGGHFSIELSKLNGIAALEAKILELASNSPSLRAEWPPEWLAVRDEVRKVRQQQPYVTPESFRTLMKKCGVASGGTQEDLAKQLHELGEILFFQERDDLSSLVILNPEWVTELIALVVRSREVRDHYGILLKSDLDRLWREYQLQPIVRDHLIHLMDWFDLTYSTGDPNELGIVVEALPYSTPDNLKQIALETGRPRMEMIFSFPSLRRRLPPGIPTWGIARAHRFSKCTPWRDAAAFEDTDTKSEAIILASNATRDVRLSVTADYPPFFFGRLEAILRDTFKRYPGSEPERRLPCPCRKDCSHSYLFEAVLKRARDGKLDVTCDRSGEDVPIHSLLTGFPPPDTVAGVRAFESEMRRRFTEQLRALNQQMEKICPSVFTLLPVQDFKLLDTWVESYTQEEELELVLYCEHDSGWHETAHSIYRFRPDQAWFLLVKDGWNKLVRITKYVGPLVKSLGKVSKALVVEAGGMIIEKLPQAGNTVINTLTKELSEKAQPEFIDIETRYVLGELINHLDSLRPATQPKKGGLHPHIIDDGRLLWLCPDHVKFYRER